MTLVDSNIFIYAAGRAHPLKHRAAAFLEKAASGTVQAAIDAETLQEILHRCRALERWKEGRVVYDTSRILVPEVLAVTGEVMDDARRLMDEEPGLMAGMLCTRLWWRYTGWLRLPVLHGTSIGWKGCGAWSRRSPGTGFSLRIPALLRPPEPTPSQQNVAPPDPTAAPGPGPTSVAG